jgi:hypothetical protein
MEPYDAEQTAIAVHVANKPGFEEQCMTALIVCGPPPRQPSTWESRLYGNQNASRVALAERNAWIDSMDDLMQKRFRYPIGYVGDFIVAFESWYAAEKQEQEFQQELECIERGLIAEGIKYE